MTTPPPNAPRRAPPPAGDAWIWLTSMGITLGLAMIIGLLGLILWQGVAVFWPKRVVELQLRPGSAGVPGGGTVLAGEVTLRREKMSRELDPATGELAPPQREWQLFIGNKDTYGFGFHFVNEADIASQRLPPEIISLERLEYGDLIGYPVELQRHDAPAIRAEDAAFAPTLRGLLAEIADRRDLIREIERVEIGKLNRTIERLTLQERAYQRQADAGQPMPATALARLAEQRAALQVKYEEYKAEATALRARQSEHALVMRLPTGETQTVKLGQLLDFYYPNQLGWFARLGHCAGAMWDFVIQEPREANTEGGIFPAIFGTFVMTVLMSLLVTPFGVITAIYLREYAKQGPTVRMVRIAINNLAGVPSIVFGVFGLGFFVYLIGSTVDEFFFSDALPTPTFGTGGVLWASLTLALLTVPVVIVAAEEALSSVPRGAREGALACGASQWQTIQRVVLPAAAPGILTGIILAMARGAGEVAPLMLVGVVKLAPDLPLNLTYPYLHLEQKFMHLGFHIYDLGFQSPDSEAAKPMVFATTLFLIALVVVSNLAAILIRAHLRKKYATSVF